MSKKAKVLLAMSGGLDSSISLYLLQKEGYEVIGITYRTYDYQSGKQRTGKENSCCSLDAVNDARSLAVKFNAPHYVLDLREEFYNSIVKDFIEEYMAGNTPNPCVLCNSYIKWNALLKKADQLGCEFLATGHYARIRKEDDRYFISKGIDEDKDQSYVLWGLGQDALKRTMFPLGNYKKTEIRAIAREIGFDNLADKKESYEICFIPDDDYRNFLKHEVKDIDERIGEGDFLLSDGTIVGKHKGYPFYTIGQRKGLEIALGEPMYVNKINPANNTVVIGPRDELFSKEMKVSSINLQKYNNIDDQQDFLVKIRYNNPGTMARINSEDKDLKVFFNQEVSAVTPGQSAVFYEGDDVIGGGIIKKVF
jgi:tRNA-specific 2-thiouridylase